MFQIIHRAFETQTGMQTELGMKMHGRLFEFPHPQVVLAPPYTPSPPIEGSVGGAEVMVICTKSDI